jgi:thiol-disulfide isomerase/thioredoxin
MAPEFHIPMIVPGDFDLRSQRGKVVVLDFWATWCGPCAKSLPGLIEAMSHFPADKVRLVGINQGETPDKIKSFLKLREWKLEVALDSDQAVGKKYGVEGIPQTVIIGPDGRIAWSETGYTPDGAEQAADAVKKLLDMK